MLSGRNTPFSGRAGGLALAPKGLRLSRSKSGVPSLRSDEIVEKFGVNTHLTWNDTNYYTLKDSHLIPAMIDLGVRVYRDSLVNPGSWGWVDLPNTYAALAAAGIKRLAVRSQDAAAANYALLQTNTASQLWGSEGVNEPADNTAATTAATEASAFWDLVRANPTYSGLKLIGPSYHLSTTAASAAGTLVGKVDGLAIHPYPGGAAPEGGEASTEAYASVVAPGAQFFSTEASYHTKTDEAGFQGVSELAAAIYGLRMIVDHLVVRKYGGSFWYEMMSANPGWNAGTFERAFGLLDEFGAKRKQFYAVKAFLTNLADPGATFSAPIIAPTLSGANPNVKLDALARRDGSYDLLVRNAVSIWNQSTKADIIVADVTETVTLPSGFMSASTMRLNENTNPSWVQQTLSGSAVTVPVGPGVTILRIAPYALPIKLNFDAGSFPTGQAFTRAGTTATYVNTAGATVTAGANVPRFDYHRTTHALLGLLYEPASENKLLQSNNFAAGNWGKNGTFTLTQNVLGPDGQSDWQRINPSGGYNGYYQGLGASFTAGQVVTHSCLVAPESGNFRMLFGTDTVNAQFQMNIDPGNSNPVGVYFLAGGATATMDQVAPAIYLCRVTGPFVANDSVVAYNVTGVAGQILIKDVQSEAGSKATSRMRTTTATVVRGADALPLIVPTGSTGLRFTFDDGSTQDVLHAPGAFTPDPAVLNRPRIKTIRSL